MVNGQGASPLIELYGVFAEAVAWIEGHGGTVARSLVGNYITSLDQSGFSITVMALDDQLLRLWDAPVETPALRWGR
jgi:dihydroxyacetone kinase-like protein